MSHLWVDDKENLDKFRDKIGVCKVVGVAEQRLEPGDQRERTGV